MIFTQEIIIITMLLTMFIFLLSGYPVAFTISGVPLLFALFGYSINIFDLPYGYELNNAVPLPICPLNSIISSFSWTV